MPDPSNKDFQAPKIYPFQFDTDRKIITTIERQGKEITKFVVSLELLYQDKWYSVARIDTEGGTPHRDRLLPNADYLTHRESIRLSLDWSMAISEAQYELQARANWYISEFMKHF